ncbi:MAG: endonuclease, partial [Bacteroidota bacterium]
SFLLEKDEKYIGKKPYRTYVGFKYNGGFSDHLPIILDLH